MIEKEVKVLLTAEQYKLFAEKLEWGEVYAQENYYYLDKEGELKRNDIMVRIRKKKGILKLQTKVPISHQGIVRVKEEREKDINQIYEILGEKHYKDMVLLEAKELFCVGNLITERKVISGAGYEIVLDKNWYFDICDFELEIEFTDSKVLGSVLGLLNSVTILEYNNISKGKNERFLQKYDEKSVEIDSSNA